MLLWVCYISYLNFKYLSGRDITKKKKKAKDIYDSTIRVE